MLSSFQLWYRLIFLALILHDVYFAVKLLRHNFELICSPTCHMLFRCYELHLTIETIICPSTPYPLFLPWFLLWLSPLCCVHHPTPGEKFVFLLLVNLSPSAPFFAVLFLSRFQAAPQPHCILLVFSPVLPYFVLPFGIVTCYSSTWCRSRVVLCRRWRRWLFGSHNISIYETLCSRWVLHIV